MKKKLVNKLSLKKETLGSLNQNQLNDLRGGGSNACTWVCNTNTCSGGCPPPDPSDFHTCFKCE